MTAELILASVDLPAPELDRTVAEFLDVSSGLKMVLADHFDLDAIAAGADALAYRLACIKDAAAPLLGEEGLAGDLARSSTNSPCPPRMSSPSSETTQD